MKMKVCVLLTGFAMLTGCASSTNAEFSCGAPKKTRCERMSQVNARVSHGLSDLVPPFDDPSVFWTPDSEVAQ